MATKGQIARRLYKCSFEDLTPGEKAAVTRKFNDQQVPEPEDDFEDFEEDFDEDFEDEFDEEEACEPCVGGSGVVTIKFGRPGINGVKEVLVNSGTTVQAALGQAGITVNATKEGVLNKEDGNTVKFNDTVTADATFMIVPGVDSATL